MTKMSYFLGKKNVKIVTVFGPSPEIPVGLHRLRLRPRLISFILLQLSAVMALKCYIVVEKEQNAPIFHFKLCSFVGRGAKYYLSQDTGSSSCVTVCILVLDNHT